MCNCCCCCCSCSDCRLYVTYSMDCTSHNDNRYMNRSLTNLMHISGFTCILRCAFGFRCAPYIYIHIYFGECFVPLFYRLKLSALFLAALVVSFSSLFAHSFGLTISFTCSHILFTISHALWVCTYIFCFFFQWVSVSVVVFVVAVVVARHNLWLSVLIWLSYFAVECTLDSVDTHRGIGEHECVMILSHMMQWLLIWCLYYF